MQSTNQQVIDIEQASTVDLDLILQWTKAIHKVEDNGELELHPQFNHNLRRWLESIIENSQFLFLIAHQNDTPAGFIAAQSVINDNGFLKSPMKGVIHLLWVEPEYRKNGIAKMLVNAVEACFVDLGISYVETNYTKHNKHGGEFWNASGYIPHSETARKLL